MSITATLFGQMITFAILVFFVNRFLWRPLTEATASRTRRIEEGLKAADQGKYHEQVARREAAKVIHEAKDKAAEIIASAEQRRNEIAEEAKHEAHAEKDRILAGAKAEIERTLAAAREQLRRELGALVIEGAGKIVAAEMNAARHASLIDDLAARI